MGMIGHLSVSVVGASVAILLIIKVLEMGWNLCQFRKLESAAVDSIFSGMTRWRTHGLSSDELDRIFEAVEWIWTPAVWPVTGRLIAMKTPVFLQPCKNFFIKKVYRWPILMLVEALICSQTLNGIVACDSMLIKFGVALVFIGLWVQLAIRFYARYKLGYLDSYFRKVWRHQLDAQKEIKPHDLFPHHLDPVQDFIRTFSSMVVITIFGYAATYSGMNAVLGGQMFHNVDKGYRGDVQLIYFSTVTLATVGYGDIYPIKQRSRIVVTTQILAGFGLLVFLLTAFSLTANHTDADSAQIRRARADQGGAGPPEGGVDVEGGGDRY